MGVIAAENAKDEIQKLLITKLNLEADLRIPMGAKAIVLFAHGSGSSRHSNRNQYVAEALNKAGIGTLLVDLLTGEEKEIDNRTRHIRFDIDLLALRVELVTNWLLQEPKSRSLVIGYFGSSTGVAAALIASTKFNNTIRAVVSRGGRPDLVGDKLDQITAPTLLIVGGSDNVVAGINTRALKELKNTECRDLVLIPGAGHLFEEPGKIEEVAEAAVDWFRFHLLRSGNKFQNRYRKNALCSISPIFKIKPMMGLKFRDRAAAGEMLVTLLRKYRNDIPIVIGIPRGGAVVADVVAKKLSFDFDIVVPRKLRAPYNSENAIGAMMQDGSVYLDINLLESMHISDEYIEAEKKDQKKEIEHRLALYRPDAQEYKINGRTAVLVDDGAATGATLIAAARWIRRQQPKKLVIAIPVASLTATQVLRQEADYLELIRKPSKFNTVEHFYHDFNPVADKTVVEIMRHRSSLL